METPRSRFEPAKVSKGIWGRRERAPGSGDAETDRLRSKAEGEAEARRSATFRRSSLGPLRGSTAPSTRADDGGMLGSRGVDIEADVAARHSRARRESGEALAVARALEVLPVWCALAGPPASLKTGEPAPDSGRCGREDGDRRRMTAAVVKQISTKPPHEESLRSGVSAAAIILSRSVARRLMSS